MDIFITYLGSSQVVNVTPDQTVGDAVKLAKENGLLAPDVYQAWSNEQPLEPEQLLVECNLRQFGSIDLDG